MMAHFAKLVNGTVDQVIVVSNEDILVDGVENEAKGITFLRKLFGQDTEWIQTSYNGNFRKKYAGIGDTYDEINDVFISPQPFASWSLDDEYNWQAPKEYPIDGKDYFWDEELQDWSEL
jgi:hypothetical protein